VGGKIRLEYLLSLMSDGRSGERSCIHQHPPGERPPIAVMFVDPPSVVGMGGGQIVEGALGAAVVVAADCVDVLSPSPGSSRGACELRDEALIPPVLPIAALELNGVDPAGAPAEIEELEGSVDVGTARGSVPVFVVVCALAVATIPKKMIAPRVLKCVVPGVMPCITLSCSEAVAELRHGLFGAEQRLGGQKGRMKFRKGTA
jgi:hypothetical protein